MTTTSVATGLALIGAAALTWGSALVELARPAEERFLAVRRFEVDAQAGLVTQQIVPVHAERLQATWSAHVDRPGTPRALCGGSGVWTYTGRPATMTLAEWTQDDSCPARLEPGDRLVASWRWGEGEDGYIDMQVVVQ